MAYALIPVLLANLAGFPMSGLDMAKLQQLNQELGRFVQQHSAPGGLPRLPDPCATGEWRLSSPAAGCSSP